MIVAPLGTVILSRPQRERTTPPTSGMRVRCAWQSARVAMRYFRRRWNDSRGDGFDSWGATTYYFEVGKDGWPTRQVESYDTGPILRYGQGREEDEYGQLGQARLDESEDWMPWAISQNEFEDAWEAAQ